MSPRILINRQRVADFCRRHHIRRLALFGSVLREDFGPESDFSVVIYGTACWRRPRFSMSRRSTFAGLRQMRDYAREAGEAASRVGSDEQATYPQVLWHQNFGLRHRLVHGYDQVDLDILWQILTRDLPPLVEELEKTVAPDARS